MPSASGVVVPLASDPKKEETKEVAVEKKVQKGSVEKPSQPQVHEDVITPHRDAAPSGKPKTPVVSEATPSPKSSGSGIFD